MRTVVISDIHNAVDRVQDLLDNLEYDQCIFLGDYFDQWGDGPGDAKKTALWLKESLKDPRHIHLIGNHDLPYIIPNRFTWCPGWDQLKHLAVNEELTPQDWGKLRPFYYDAEYSVLYSHAGFSRMLFWGLGIEDMLHKASKDYIEVLTGNEALSFVQGQDVGYPAPFSGILWQRWSAMLPVDGCTQIVGHTPLSRPAYKYHNNDGVVIEAYKVDLYNCRAELGIAMNIDTSLKYYITIENGQIKTFIWN